MLLAILYSHISFTINTPAAILSISRTFEWVLLTFVPQSAASLSTYRPWRRQVDLNHYTVSQSHVCYHYIMTVFSSMGSSFSCGRTQSKHRVWHPRNVSIVHLQVQSLTSRPLDYSGIFTYQQNSHTEQARNSSSDQSHS